MSFLSNLLLIILVVAAAIFINYPAPPLSNRLKKWKESGQFFAFKDHNIFYRDSKGTGKEEDVLLILHGFPSSSYDFNKGTGKEEDVLLILHGFPSSSYDFNKVWDDLSIMFGRVIVTDFLGYGFSDKPEGYNYLIGEKADSVEFLLKKLGHTRYHILAHDMGDTVAQELIHRQNKLIEDGKKGDLEILSVCLLNGGILPETLELRWIQKVLLNPWLAPIALRLNNRFIFKISFGEVFGEKTQPTAEEFEDYFAASRHNDGHLVTADLIQYLPQRFANRDKWVGALQDTQIPLHLIFGPSDPINPPDTFLKRYKQLVPQSGVTQLPSHISHYPHLEDPAGVVKAYKQFFKSLRLN